MVKITTKISNVYPVSTQILRLRRWVIPVVLLNVDDSSMTDPHIQCGELPCFVYNFAVYEAVSSFMV